jgi:hypothetical protein
MALRKFLKGIADDVKKAAKGSKEYQEGKKAKRLTKAYKGEGMDKKAAKAKAKVKAKDPATGKVRKGAKGVKSTKGGEFVKYGKKSKAATSFRSAFAKARKEGKSSFSWDGRSYSTAMKGDKKKASKAKGKGVTVSSVGKNRKKPIDKKGMQVTKSAITESMRGKKKDKVLAAKKPSNPPLISDKAKQKIKDVATKGVVGSVMVDEVKKREDAGNMGMGGKVKSYGHGGKVDGGGMYNWPTRDARNGGKK